jgi:hypothetical protein
MSSEERPFAVRSRNNYLQRPRKRKWVLRREVRFVFRYDNPTEYPSSFFHKN